MTEFGNRLKQIRIDRNMSQDDMAKLLGTSKQVISRYETGQRSPKITVAYEYAQRLNVSLSYILGGSPNSDKKQPTINNDDELWKLLSTNETKLMLARWISELNDEQLQIVEDLLKAARLTPNE